MPEDFDVSANEILVHCSFTFPPGIEKRGDAVKEKEDAAAKWSLKYTPPMKNS